MPRRDKTDNKENTLIMIAFLVLLSLFIFGQGFGYMGGMMFFGPVFMILLLVLIVWLIVSLTQQR
jgi:fatty-acid desaturase